uniref:Methyltransferase type 11 domain-containing protein n=1 Tax=Arundo donax TaxID=35708 RepID=A0A0A9EZK9_ARUDO
MIVHVILVTAGDVAFREVERIKSVSHGADIKEDTHIYVCDINPNMLNVGKKRAAERGYKEEHCLSWIQGDVEALSFKDGSLDGYTIAFGIRNVTHIEKALSEAYKLANLEILNQKAISGEELTS